MIIIDYSDKRPIYEQITEKFQKLILSGVLEADEKMPSVRSLAVELAINPNTIQRAYRELEQSGFIYTIKGRGNFVSRNEGFLEEKRKSTLKELAVVLESCYDTGVTREDIEEEIAKVYKEVQK